MKLQKSSCQGRVFLPRVYLCGATGSRTRDPLTVKFKSLAAKVKSSCQGFTLAGRTFSQGDEGSNLLPAKVSRENLSSYQGAKVFSAKVPGRFPWYQEWPYSAVTSSTLVSALAPLTFFAVEIVTTHSVEKEKEKERGQ